MAIAHTARGDHVRGGGDDRHRRDGKAYQAEGGGGPHVVPALAQNSDSKMKLPLFDDDTEVDEGNRHADRMESKPEERKTMPPLHIEPN